MAANRAPIGNRPLPEHARAVSYPAGISKHDQDESERAGTGSLFGPDGVASDEPIDGRHWAKADVEPEFYLSERAARLGAIVLAGLLAVGALAWLWVTTQLFSVSELACSRCDDGWFRWAQLLLALAGIAMTVVVIVFLTYFWRTGRVWRHRRAVATVFGLLVAGWALILVVVLPRPF